MSNCSRTSPQRQQAAASCVAGGPRHGRRSAAGLCSSHALTVVSQRTRLRARPPSLFYRPSSTPRHRKPILRSLLRSRAAAQSGCASSSPRHQQRRRSFLSGAARSRVIYSSSVGSCQAADTRMRFTRSRRRRLQAATFSTTRTRGSLRPPTSYGRKLRTLPSLTHAASPSLPSLLRLWRLW